MTVETARSRFSRGSRQERVQARDYALLAGLALIGGSSFLFQKIAVQEITPLSVTAWRLGISAVLMGLILGALAWRAPAVMRIGTRGWAGIAGSAFIGMALPWYLTSWAVRHIDSGLAAILLGAMPLVTIFIAHFATADEKLNGAKLMAVVIGIAGLVILFWPTISGTGGQDPLAKLVVIAAAVCYAVNALIQKRLIGLEAPVLMGLPVIVAALIVVPLALFRHEGAFELPGFRTLAAVTALAALPTVAALFVTYEIIARQGAGFFGQINLVAPPIAVFYGYIFLGEVPEGHAFLALAIILAGVFVSRNWNSRKAPATTLP